jgi:predicted DNA-binding transcriptional regulator AlpA
MAQYLPRPRVAKRYNVNPRTIWRWEKDEKLGFPEPIEINGRRYWIEDKLDEFDRQCARRTAGDPKAA